jgi:hypothetical protein
VLWYILTVNSIACGQHRQHRQHRQLVDSIDSLWTALTACEPQSSKIRGTSSCAFCSDLLLFCSLLRMPLVDAHDLRSQYSTLVENVQHSLRAQMGDAHRLREVRDQVLAFRIQLSAFPVRASLRQGRTEANVTRLQLSFSRVNTRHSSPIFELFWPT